MKPNPSIARSIFCTLSTTAQKKLIRFDNLTSSQSEIFTLFEENDAFCEIVKSSRDKHDSLSENKRAAYSDVIPNCVSIW